MLDILGQILTASAVSYTVSGNSGISSFLTLFVLGCVQRAQPDLLEMPETTATLLASWPSLCLLGALTVTEFVAMCVPVVDAVTDQIMTFVVPIVSLIATMGTLGLYPSADEEDEEGQRRLGVVGSSSLVLLQTIVIVTGIGLAITMHLFKMLIRLIGEGWLTNILTVLEATWCLVTISLAVFIQTFAIFTAGIFLGAAAWHWGRKWMKKDQDEITGVPSGSQHHTPGVIPVVVAQPVEIQASAELKEKAEPTAVYHAVSF